MFAKRNWKPLLIDAYRWATWPYRALSLNAAKRSGQVPIAILFYHRVADEDLNPWTISTTAFTQQIDWLENRFDLISLEDVQSRVRSGFNDRPAVSITFDDGYSDNCTFALPLLIRRGIPVTYFVTTSNVLDLQPFRHDVVHGKPHHPNSVEMVRALAEAGVEIGAHTRTHPDLRDIKDPTTLADEIVGATEELQAAIGRPLNYFAFPFGQPANLNAEVFRLALKFGFRGVCSAYGGWNEIGGDAFHLLRFHGDPRLACLKNWLTLDPRKRNHAQAADVEKMLAEARTSLTVQDRARPTVSLTQPIEIDNDVCAR